MYIIEHCPRGEDPLTNDETIKSKTFNKRQIKVEIASTYNILLNGTLSIQFLGSTIYLDLLTPTNKKCEDAFEINSKFSDVTCNYVSISKKFQRIIVTFEKWPTYTTDNNLYITKEPSAVDFYCDSTLTNRTKCLFQDITTTDIAGKYIVFICVIFSLYIIYYM